MKFPRILKPENEEDKKQQQLLIVLLLAGTGYYFLVYLPQEEIRKLEMEIQTDIDKLKDIKSQEYSGHLTKLQSYLKWRNGIEFQQSALTNKQEDLNKAIQ